MDVAVDHCRVGSLRSHLDDFYVEIVFVERLPLLCRKQMKAANRCARNGDPDFTLPFLRVYWGWQAEHQATERDDRLESKIPPKISCFHAELRPEFNQDPERI